MIRYIEKVGDELYYKSGGGITIDSNPQDEYQELLDKIYLAI
jgi:para-aminobenzoate synthetase component 1